MITRRNFIKVAAGSAALTAYGRNALAQTADSTGAANAVPGDLYPQLKSVGSKFSFAIFADPHIDPKEMTGNTVGQNGLRTLTQAISEVNAMDPMPAFVFHIGDLTNVPVPSSVENWFECTQALKPPQAMSLGNHDGLPPYNTYLALQKRVCGFSSPFYSFDCGGWHFVVVACNLHERNDVEKDIEARMLAFLAADLERTKDKPIIVMHHYHFLPVGLSQTEWYLFSLELRQKLIELYTRHGNVKWAFNGHVHNGLLASEKTSWSYRGINFVNLPTIIVGRPFGEEHPGYEKGLTDGGYYTVIQVDGDNVSLQGHLAGVPEPHPYPAKLQEFTESIEPRQFKTIEQFAPVAALANGDFSQGLTQWYRPYRYLRADKPVYSSDVIDDATAPGGKALAITTREAGEPTWARDEYNEAYQIISLDQAPSPLVSLSYKINETPAAGGGYLRLEMLRDNAFIALMMFYWGQHEERSDYYPRSVGYSLSGVMQNWLYLQQIGKRHQGFFWRLPMVESKWHNLTVNMAELYGQALNDPGAFTKAQPNKLSLAIGTWNDRQIGTRSEAFFSNVKIGAAPGGATSTLDGQALAYTADVAKVAFGQELENDVRSHAHPPRY